MTKNFGVIEGSADRTAIDRRTLMRWGLATAAMSFLPLRARGDEHSAKVRNALALPVGGPQQHYDLSIGKSAVNFSGKSATAVTVNGVLPSPLLHFREGDTVTINVTNTLPEITSVHWHGLIIPNDQDGVPGITFPGIHQGETFRYQFKLRQNGTYWYHSHAILQEPAGFYGPLIIDAAEPEPFEYEREYVVLLSDWNDTPPEKVLANLKKVEGYYNHRRLTLLDLRQQLREAKSEDERAAIWRERLAWAQMRMDPTDFTDGGPEWQYLMHGQNIDNNWTALFTPGERIRLRIINGAAMNFFDFSIPGLPMTVVAADGLHVQPIVTNELRIGVGETWDVIVTPKENKAYTVFAETTGRVGFARGTLAPEPFRADTGIAAPIPAPRTRPVLTMADMAGVHDHGAHAAHVENAAHDDASARDHSAMNHSAHDHQAMLKASAVQSKSTAAKSVEHLTYTDMRALTPSTDRREPTQTIEMKLTGDMHRYFWSINGKKMARENFFNARRGERLRFVITNTTMMEHPMHVHGAFFELDNGAGEYAPRKHTLIVKPGQTVNLLTSFDETGVWMFHCHLAYHALTGMMQAVVITEAAPQEQSQKHGQPEHVHEHH